MGRKLIIAFAVLAIIAVMVGAPMHEAFEGHDTKPFPIDPEFIMMMLGSLLTMCLSVVLLTLPCLAFALAVAYALTVQLNLPELSYWSSFEHDRLLFSPPRSLFSLRI